MAVGDVVNGIITVTGNYQPASGVEVNITSLGLTGTSDDYGLYDGTNNAPNRNPSDGTMAALKIFVTNTRYLRYTKTTAIGSYSGVQVK